MQNKYKRPKYRHLKNFGKTREVRERENEPIKKKSKTLSFFRSLFLFIFVISVSIVGGFYLSKNSNDVSKFISDNSSKYFGEYVGGYLNKFVVIFFSNFEPADAKITPTINPDEQLVRIDQFFLDEKISKLIEKKLHNIEIGQDREDFILDIENIKEDLNSLTKKIDQKNKKDNLELFKKRVSSLEDSFLYFGSSQKTELNILRDAVSSIQDKILRIDDDKKSNKDFINENKKLKLDFDSLVIKINKIESFNKNFYSRFNVLVSVLRLRNFQNNNESLLKATETLALAISKLDEPIALGRIASLSANIKKMPPTRADLYKKFPLVISELKTLFEEKNDNSWYSEIKRNLKSVVQVRQIKNPVKGSIDETILNLESAISEDNLDYAISLLSSLNLPSNFFTIKWIKESVSRLNLENSLDLLEEEVVAIVIEE